MCGYRPQIELGPYWAGEMKMSEIPQPRDIGPGAGSPLRSISAEVQSVESADADA